MGESVLIERRPTHGGGAASAIDIHDPVRALVIQKLKTSGTKEEQVRVVREFAEVSTDEQNALFGEELPAGLRLVVQP